MRLRRLLAIVFLSSNPGAIASFLASDGARVVDPDGSGPIWETPITPHELTIADEQLSFIGPPIFLSHIP
jgi:hypothetical protein